MADLKKELRAVVVPEKKFQSSLYNLLAEFPAITLRSIDSITKSASDLTDLRKLEPTGHIYRQEKFRPLLQALPTGSVLFPGCKAYEQSIFIGNLLYWKVTPSAVVQAVTVEDVMATVSFAAENGYKLSIKSGGHSMGGYCLNDGGIVLDIGSMNNVEFEYLVMPLDGKRVVQPMKSGAISIQGGAVWQDAFTLCRNTNPQLVTIGGNCPSVGVSAYLLGGGVSPFSRCYGLGIDNLLEMTIVTADGKKVIVTDHETDPDKRDLFWAVRGGGGGNFGVSVGVKVRVHNLRETDGVVTAGNITWNLDKLFTAQSKPDPEETKQARITMPAVNSAFNTAASGEKRFKNMMKKWNTGKWERELRGDALWHYKKTTVDDYTDLCQLQGQMTIVYNGRRQACDAALGPILYDKDIKPEVDEREEMHWTDWEHVDGKIDVFDKIYHRHASFIFGEGGITEQVVNIITNDLMKAPELLKLMAVKDNGVNPYILWHHMGGRTTDVGRDDTAFFWRDGFYIFHVKVTWQNEKVGKEMLAFVEKCKKMLIPYSLQGKAAYLNYIDPTVSNWMEAYYGDHYQKLCHIKDRWDPTGFFDFPQGLRHQPIPLIPTRLNNGQTLSVESITDSRQYALPNPQLLGRPKTSDEVFSNSANLRRLMISHQSN